MSAGLIFILIFVSLLTAVFLLAKKGGELALGLPWWLADVGGASNMFVWAGAAFAAALIGTAGIEILF